MNLFLKLSSLVAMTVAFSSCGSSETSEHILRLGGISSTGNKDDENTKEKKQDSNAPLVPGEMCKNPLDLSPRIYRNTATASGIECAEGDHSSACIVEFRFEDLSSFTATYRGHSAETPSFVSAEYNACGQSLVTSFHKPGELSLSEDQKTITNKALGLVFKLVE